MINEDKKCLENKKLTESLLLASLATCESVISRNAYLEKKWSNNYRCGGQTAGDDYKLVRLEGMAYREKLRSVLLKRYQMKKIIQMTKSCTDKVTHKVVKEVIGLIDANDYVLV